MIEFIPYNREHAAKIGNLAIEKGLALGDIAAEAHEYFPATTVTLNKEPIACFGVHDMWPGVGDVWAIFHKDILSLCPREFIDGTRNTLDTLSKRYHRLQCVVSSESPESQSFVQHYGFKKEGVLKKYSHDKRDFIMYARVTS